MKKILVIASTFPASDNDPVPAFVRDQIIAMKRVDSNLHITVLAPHDMRSKTRNHTKHPLYDEYRFHYFWPYQFERLAGRGIMPALSRNKLYYLLVPFLFAGEFLALYQLTKKLKPDLLYAHWFTPQAVVANGVSALTGVPYAFTTHASDVKVWRLIPLVGKLIVRHTTRRASAFTAVSSRTMNKLKAFFRPAEWAMIEPRLSVIPMGIHPAETTNDITRLDEIKTKYNLKGKKVILFIGRLVEIKGVQYLLQAFSQLKDSDACVIIAGEGSAEADLVNLARSLNIRNVKFVGYITGAEKISFLQLADILVIPSITLRDGSTEGLPVALMEGLSYGKICVATDASGAGELMTNNQQGFIVPEKNAKALGQALNQAINLSPARLQQMKQAAITQSQKLDWQSIAARHIEALQLDQHAI